MKLFNQRDYPDVILGYGPTTIGTHGCKLTSFSMITGIDPVILNEKFKKDRCFIRDLLIDSKIGDSLDSLFEGILIRDPKKICVAEVDMSPSPGKQQHFVVWMADGTIWDPWTGTVRPANTYPIINYRVFNFDKYLSDMKPTKKMSKLYTRTTGKDGGENLNDNEQDEYADITNKKLDKLEQLENQTPVDCSPVQNKLNEANKKIEEMTPLYELGKQFKDCVNLSQNS